MARITWLADVLRAAGCAVREDDQSWKTRGSSTFDPRGLIIHATAGPLAQSNDSAYNVLVYGRAGLAGPIAQVMVERHTGRWRPVCSGRSNHAKTGWAGNCHGLGNTNLIGIEFHHANTSAEPWTEWMLDNYARGAAAICRRMGWGIDRIALHKEHQPGEKSDTTFDGNGFRTRVHAYLNPAPTPLEDEDMAKLVFAPGRGWARVGVSEWFDVDNNDPALTNDEQIAANANAKVWGSSIILTDTEWDALRATYPST